MISEIIGRICGRQYLANLIREFEYSGRVIDFRDCCEETRGILPFREISGRRNPQSHYRGREDYGKIGATLRNRPTSISPGLRNVAIGNFSRQSFTNARNCTHRRNRVERKIAPASLPVRGAHLIRVGELYKAARSAADNRRRLCIHP